MKPLHILVSLVVFTACQSVVKTPDQPTDSIKTIVAMEEFTKPFHEVVTIDLNNDGKVDTITMNVAPDGDPGTFKKITIALNEGYRQTYHLNDAWDSIDASFLEDNINAVSSPLVYVYKDSTQFAILLFGFPFGAGREDFNIIYGQGDHFKMIFDDAYDNPIKLHRLADGQLEFIGQRSAYELYGHHVTKNGDSAWIGAYGPFTVFTLNKDTAVLNLDATRDYNTEHYLWLGPDYSEKVKILYFRDHRKPEVLAEE